MVIRASVFVLLLANIFYYGWQLYRPAGSGDVVAPVPLPPDAPQLVLLREREAELLSGQATTLGADDGSSTACFGLGPFSNQADLRRSFNAIAPHVGRSRQRQTVESQDLGFWVFLPAVATREEALRVARELSGAGLRDYYVVTAGDEENTISLGLFRQEENARRRLAALNTLGFNAEIARRTEESRVYWLDYAAAPDASVPWEVIVASNPGVERRPIPCFRAE